MQYQSVPLLEIKGGVTMALIKNFNVGGNIDWDTVTVHDATPNVGITCNIGDSFLVFIDATSHTSIGPITGATIDRTLASSSSANAAAWLKITATATQITFSAQMVTHVYWVDI